MKTLFLALVFLPLWPAQADPWTDPDAIVDALERDLPAAVESPAQPAPAPLEEDCGPAPPGWLSINTHPWTRVSLDGREVGSTPLFRVRLASGPHELRLWNDANGTDHVRTVDVESRHTTKLHLFLDWRGDRSDVVTLAPDDEVAAPAEDCAEDDVEVGFLSVDATPWARVYIDGRPVGSTPLFKHRVKPGGHSLRLERVAADGTPATFFLRVDVARAETVKIVVDARDPVDRGS